jgi:hypothetical protein
MICTSILLYRRVFKRERERYGGFLSSGRGFLIGEAVGVRRVSAMYTGFIE